MSGVCILGLSIIQRNFCRLCHICVYAFYNWPNLLRWVRPPENVILLIFYLGCELDVCASNKKQHTFNDNIMALIHAFCLPLAVRKVTHRVACLHFPPATETWGEKNALSGLSHTAHPRQRFKYPYWNRLFFVCFIAVVSRAYIPYIYSAFTEQTKSVYRHIFNCLFLIQLNIK